MHQQVRNRKSGKIGIVIERKEERLLVQCSKSKIWGLAENFEFIEPVSLINGSEQDIHAPLDDKPDFSRSEPAAPKRETEFSKTESSDRKDYDENVSHFSDSEPNQSLVWEITQADLKKFMSIGAKISAIFDNEDLDIDEAFFVLDLVKHMSAHLANIPVQTYDIETSFKLSGLM